MDRMKRKSQIAAASALMLILASCSLLGLDTGVKSGSGGSVRISMIDPLFSGEAQVSRTIEPTTGNLAVTTYLIEGTAPGNLTVGPVTADSISGHTFTNLAAGTWTFTATGKNASNVSITSGGVSVAVVENASASGTILMKPAAGSGQYSFTVNWPSGSGVGSPSVSLKTSGGVDASPAPSLTAWSTGVAIEGAGLPTGSYTLDFSFARDGKTMHVVEILQVFNGLDSIKTTDLSLTDLENPPVAPSGLEVAASNRAVVLSWTDNSITESGFVLERKVDLGEWTVLSSSIAANATTYTDSDVTFNKAYSYRIKAANDNGHSAASASASFSATRVASVEVGSDFFLVKGGTTVMSATVPGTPPPFDDRVTWTSSDAAVATIDGHSGALSALTLGTSTITATTVDGGYTDSCVVTVCPEPVISAFGFMKAQNESLGVSCDCYGIISGTAIAVIVPYGADVTALKATFTSTGTDGTGLSSIMAGVENQTSGTSVNDFTNPVEYVVTAADGTFRNYMVTVQFALPGTAGLSFVANPLFTVSITGVPDYLVRGTNATLGSSIDPPQTGLTYQWYMDGLALSGETASSLTGGSNLAYGSHRAGLAVIKNGYIFSAEASFRVTLPRSWALTSFSFASPPAVGVIDGPNHTVSVTLPYGSARNPLIASFSSKGTRVRVGTVVQVSGTTANDFTNPVVYNVTSVDGSFENYTVTVTVAPNPAKAITAFSIVAPAATGTINEAEGTISATLPYGTNRGSLVASFTTTGSSVTVYGVTQESGTTSNNFIYPVDYMVQAADSTTKTYAVTITNDYGHVYYVGNGNTGGSAPIDSRDYMEGQQVAALGKGDLVKVVAAENNAIYRFVAWNTAADGTGASYQPGQGFEFGAQSITLYAKWAPLAIGDPGPAGGIVFYDQGYYSGAWRYLEAAPTEAPSTLVWYSSGTATGAIATAIGSGLSNTTTIALLYGAGSYAARYCYDLSLGGYDDWFLPSKDELFALYQNLYLSDLGSFTADEYWSSSEFTTSNTHALNFSSGVFAQQTKNSSKRVRPIRGF